MLAEAPAPLVDELDSAGPDEPFARTPWKPGTKWDQFRSQHR